MSDFAVYTDLVGLIVRQGTCASGIIYNQAGDGESVLDITSYSGINLYTLDTDYYVSNGVLTERSSFPGGISSTTITANGVDTVTISGIPSATTVSVARDYLPAKSWVVNDGEFTFTADLTGIYDISCTWSGVLYKAGEYSVEAT